MSEHTIAGIATAPGEAGIAIVRISGPAAMEIADRIFKSGGPPPSQQPDRIILHGTICVNGMPIDEVIMLIMRAPRSYTREDVVEIQCHGGTVCARRVLQCVLRNGAKPAEPGEFTKRAFLNGRIDLVQAEAVLDLIRARSERAAQSAMEQLNGRLSSLFGSIYDKLIALVAEIEARLDFPDETDLPESGETVTEELEKIKAEIECALTTWEEGHILREGALVVISGKPNTGKSSLLNVLLGKDRAIVSQAPGTTRDTIEETIVLDGIPIRLVDTAGLRDPESEVEAHGINRARQQYACADIRIHLIDCSKPLDGEDETLLNSVDINKTIVVLNKADLPVITHPTMYKDVSLVLISCLTGSGINDLKRLLVNKLGCIDNPCAHAVISERHRNILACAHSDISEAIEASQATKEEAVTTSYLRCSAERVGLLLGRSYSDDMLDSIFDRFCIGK